MRERGSPFIKKLDFFLGVPILLTLSLFRWGRKKITSPVSSIGLLKASSIGDTVLLSAIVEDLRCHFPKAHIIFFAGSSNFEVAEILMGSHSVVRLPMLDPLSAILKLRKYRFDVFIDCDSWPKVNAIISFFSLSRFRIGFKTPGQWRHFCYDVIVNHSWNVHELENYRKLVREVGVIPVAQPKFKRSVDLTSKVLPAVLFHPWPGGSRAQEKMWKPELWIQLAEELKKRGYQIFLSTGPRDVEKSTGLALLASKDLFRIVQPKSLRDLIDTLSGCHLVVSVDTGIAHLSAALGQKSVVLHGPTSPQRWGALGPRVRYVKDSQKPVINLGFEIPREKVVGLGFAEVRDTVVSLLEEKDCVSAEATPRGHSIDSKWPDPQPIPDTIRFST